MSDFTEWTYDGYDGKRVARTWPTSPVRYVALLCHGYGEHIGRYDHVAEALVDHGAVVHGVDHAGHGRSEGERVLIPDFEPVVDDFRILHGRALERDPGLPVVLIGHSMGGLIATRYAQTYGADLTALVLSGPVLGSWAVLPQLLEQDEIPETPIDPATLSRDPAVGAAYESDPLVWHGSFKRPTLEALQRALDVVNEGGRLNDVPTLWLHGEHDQLVPMSGTYQGIDRIHGHHFEQKIYPEARHEIFNETNRDEVLDDVKTFVDRQLNRA